MKVHELVNVLNHVNPDAEWDGADLLTAPECVYSINEMAVKLMPHLVPGTDEPAEEIPQG